jgi:O-methyltransferase
MRRDLDGLYLALMKNALSFALWPEPPVPVETFNYLRPPVKRFLLSLASRFLRIWHLQLVQDRRVTMAMRREGRLWPAYAHTMIGSKRLDNLQSCIEAVIRDDVEGDLIETGVWRGGACIFMRAVLAAHHVENRRVFVADSFEGLPKPEAEKYPPDEGDRHHLHTFLAVSQAEVEDAFRKYGLLDDQVVFVKGWFAHTLPALATDKLSILRLDGDMYGSTMDALNNLYPKLSKGGFCIVDDYALPSSRMAADDYRAQHGIDAEMKVIDWTGVYWRKE